MHKDHKKTNFTVHSTFQ